MRLRALSADDGGALAQFRCARPGAPWTEIVEKEVQGLASLLDTGALTAIGAFRDDGKLCGVAVWRLAGGEPLICRGDLVAVAVTEQRSGHGRALKEAMIHAAREAGAIAVTSLVHRQNAAMLELNRSFGAELIEVADKPDYWGCLIPLTS